MARLLRLESVVFFAGGCENRHAQSACTIHVSMHEYVCINMYKYSNLQIYISKHLYKYLYMRARTGNPPTRVLACECVHANKGRSRLWRVGTSLLSCSGGCPCLPRIEGLQCPGPATLERSAYVHDNRAYVPGNYEHACIKTRGQVPNALHVYINTLITARINI